MEAVIAEGGDTAADGRQAASGQATGSAAGGGPRRRGPEGSPKREGKAAHAKWRRGVGVGAVDGAGMEADARLDGPDTRDGGDADAHVGSGQEWGGEDRGTMLGTGDGRTTSPGSAPGDAATAAELPDLGDTESNRPGPEGPGPGNDQHQGARGGRQEPDGPAAGKVAGRRSQCRGPEGTPGVPGWSPVFAASASGPCEGPRRSV